MHKTLLLCFIHGFKGGDDTFAGFPEHLRALASHALPNITVKAVTYPKFETRGDLKECVGRFREWLQNNVIDLEVAASTPSPTVDPSVHTILIGHSMGGIVAAETLLAITSDSPIPSQKDPLPSMASQTVPGSQPPPPDSEGQTFMFPYIQGILAFDTPYLGISPGVVAHSAEQHYKTVTGAYSALSDVAGVLGYGASKKDTYPNHRLDNQKLLTQGADAMSASMTNASSDAAAVPAWQRWGKYAMFAGAAGAVAAGGAAAYLKRDTITEGWSFIGSHLEFVGCLARGEELKSRLERISQLNKDRNIGFADVITVLGKGAIGDKRSGTTVPNTSGFVEIGSVDGIAPSERTFCTIPKSEKNRKFFEKAKNDKASDEMQAHMTMFDARENSGYFTLGERSRDFIVQWVMPEASEWYKESEPAGGMKKVMMDVDLGGDETESNPWAGDEPITQASKGEDENEHGPILPKWIEEYHKCSTSPHRRENRAAVAISTLKTDKWAGNAVALRRPHMRPLKIGTPRREMESTKASGWNDDVGVTTPTTPQTPQRRRPPKLGRPKAELEVMKPTKSDDETRSTTPDGHGHARSPRPGQIKVDVASNQAGDQGATPVSPRRRPPKLGPSKAGTPNKPSASNSAKAEITTRDPDFESTKAKTNTPTVELKTAERETNVTTLRFDNAKLEPNTIAQAEASIKNAKPNSAKVGTCQAAPESNSAKAETAATAPNFSKTSGLEINKPGGATPGQPRLRPRKVARLKAGAESQGHNAKIEISPATAEYDSVTGKTSATAPILGKPPEIETRVADDSEPGDRRPMPKPPKLGPPKAELGSQKPMKLAEKDEKSTLAKPYTGHPKLGNTKADLESQKPEKLAKKDEKSTPGRPYTQHPKLRNSKADPESQKPQKLAKKDEESTPEKPYTEHPKLGNTNADPEIQGPVSEQAAKRADRESRDAIPEGLSLLAEGTSNLEDTTPPITRKMPAKLKKPKAELEPTKSNKLSRKEEGVRKSTLGKPANAELESGEAKAEQASKETDEESRGNAPPTRPHPKSPAPEVDARDERAEDGTLPAGRARPPKLGRPKAGQANGKAERESTVEGELARKEET